MWVKTRDGFCSLLLQENCKEKTEFESIKISIRYEDQTLLIAYLPTLLVVFVKDML